MKTNIYCFTIKHYAVLNRLPNNFIPFGLGSEDFPSHWLTEKEGKNIMHLNNFYGEATGMYWIWKNHLKNLDKKSKIGFCQHRRLWLNDLFNEKQKKSFNSLFSQLLTEDNQRLKSSETILIQPTIFKNENLIQQFDKLYGEKILLDCVNFIEEKDKNDFITFLKSNKLSICNMFITEIEIFNQYCHDMFNWIDKCYNYCMNKNLLTTHNSRLAIFMVERFTSFWFEKYSKCEYLSFARLGNFFLSDKVNKYINPLKLPLTMRSYPTIHRY